MLAVENRCGVCGAGTGDGIGCEIRGTMRDVTRLVLAAAGMAIALAGAAAAVSAAPVHGIAMHGAVMHPAGMKAFPYVNPEAPKGGRLRLGMVGSFDSLNIFSFKGEKGAGIRGYVYESLLVRAGDEPFSLYGLIAETIDLAADRGEVTFQLRAEARFSDGKPLTAEDVLFSHALLRDRGTQNQRGYYAKVEKAEAAGPRGVRFVFKREANGEFDRELPLIIGLMPILPKHATRLDVFEDTSLERPIGSGSYVVDRIEQGRVLSYKRLETWWGKDLAVNRGRYNFGEISYEYFKDSASLFEAFKSGEVDLLADDDPVRWTTAYDFPAVREGRVVKREFPSKLSAGMNALAFNIRKPVFQDVRVREALILLFDFEWINRSLYGGVYRRTQSYFERSILSSSGQPTSVAEQALLAPFPGAVRGDVMDGTAALPKTDGSGSDRTNMRRALELLAQAGFRLEGRKLLHVATKAPLAFEILAQKRSEQRLLLSYVRALESIGVAVTLRMVDSSQHKQRTLQHQFDMVWEFWPGTLSPGNEQVYRWGSQSAELPGTFNIVGVKSPAADAMISALLAAQTYEELTAAARALDRVLRSGAYVVPLFHLPTVWVAHHSHLKSPETVPYSGIDLDTWWIGP